MNIHALDKPERQWIPWCVNGLHMQESKKSLELIRIGLKKMALRQEQIDLMTFEYD